MRNGSRTFPVIAMVCLVGVAGAWAVQPPSGQRSERPPSDQRRLLQAPPLPRAAQAAPLYAFRAAPGILGAKAAPAVMVYRVVRSQPTRDAVCELAAKVGVPVSSERYALLPPTMADGRDYMATVGQLTENSLGDLDVTLFDDGNYMATIRSQAPGQTQPACSDEMAKSAAELLLTGSGLLPPGAEFVRVADGEAVEFTTPESRSIQQRVTGKAVLYRRRLGGLRGGSLDVRVNGNGRVYSITRNARNVAPLEPYPVLSATEVLEALNGGYGVVTGPVAPTAPGAMPEAVVDRIEMLYYEASPGTELDTVQPIYLVSGAVAGVSARFSAVLPAVRPEYLVPARLPAAGGGADARH